MGGWGRRGRHEWEVGEGKGEGGEGGRHAEEREGKES